FLAEFLASLWRRNSTRVRLAPSVLISATIRSVRTTTDSPLTAGAAAPGTLPLAGCGAGAAAAPGLAAGVGTVVADETGACTWAGGLGRCSFSRHPTASTARNRR